MKIERASSIGFCFGVKRAINLLEKACLEYRKIDSIGPVVHNWWVIDRLSKMGVRTIDSLSEVEGDAVAIPSHGLGPEKIKGISLLGLKVIDATCPIVKRAQQAAKELSKEGFQVIIFGDASHPEVRGVLEWSQGRGIALKDEGELKDLSISEKIGVISQTTQNLEKFLSFSTHILSLALQISREVRIINTICREVILRQKEALELAHKVDLMLVIGSRLSANTRRLAEICSPVVKTHLIESWQDIDLSWFSGSEVKKLGVISGTSTPDELIEEVMEGLRNMGWG